MNSTKNLLVILLIGVVLLVPGATWSAQYMGRDILTGTWQGEPVEYVDGEILFMIKNGQDPAPAKHYLAGNNLSLTRELDRFGFGKVSLPHGRNMFPVIERMQKTGFFLYVEPNMIDWVSLHPDDHFYLTNQWGLNNTGQSGGTIDADIDAPEAWDSTTGSSDVIVSVLDSGIPMESDTLSHEDLDNTSKIILGQDCVGDGEGVKDENGHGTHVAGIISAETNNSLGVAGVCWDCRIMVNQVFTSSGSGSHLAFRDGMIYSVDNGAHLVNYSGGGSQSATKEHGVAYADSHGVLLVAAAGNRNGGSVIYPGAYSSTYQNVVCVSSTDHNDSVSSFSSIGDEVCVAAPGGSGYPFNDVDDIFSTMPNYQVTLNQHGISPNYGYCAGTSMASPMVAGVAALMLSVNPALPPSEVREILEETAEQVGDYDYDSETGKCTELGHGRINAHEAVLAALAPRAVYRVEEPDHWYHPPIKVLPNQTRSITFKVFSIGNEALTYSVSSDQPCIQVSVPPSQLQPKDSIEISVLLDGTGACNGTFIAGNVILTTDESGGKVVNLRVHAVVADDYYECPRDPETVDTLENDYLKLYVNANCQQWIHDIGYVPDTTHEVFVRGGTIVATTSGIDTLVGRFMGDNDMRAGAQDKLYREECGPPAWEYPFTILFTKEIYIEASHLSPPNHFKWFWWEVAKLVKFFNPPAPEDYQRIVVKYVKVKRQDPPAWWPDLTPFTDYEETYIGFAMDLDAPFDSAGGPEPFVGDEIACNYAGYDATNEIAYVRGFGRVGEHPEYEDYHAGLALAEVNAAVQTTPYATANVKNNQYLYPTSPWGWVDGELYRLASTPGNYIQDPDSIVDRSIVLIAHKIVAGDDPNMEAGFTLIEVLAPTGLAEMQALVATGRDIAAERATCGDVQGDGIVNVGDVVYLVIYLYRGGPAPYCPTARGDVNADGVINVGDVVYLVRYLYKGGSEPDCPGIWY